MTRLAILLIAILLPFPTHSQDLVADISSHEVQVTTGFTGANLIVFGSMERSGDIAIVVEGPTARATVRQKSRMMGIWVNTDSYIFDDVPGYYAVASSKPVADMLSPATIANKKLTLDKVDFPVRKNDARAETFRQALIQRRQYRGFYSQQPGGVTVQSGHLFRSAFALPANVPMGPYNVYVYLIRDGHIQSMQKVVFSVDEIGLSATIFEAAKNYSVLYAFASLLMAIAMGGGSAWLFRRMS